MESKKTCLSDKNFLFDGVSIEKFLLCVKVKAIIRYANGELTQHVGRVSTVIFSILLAKSLRSLQGDFSEDLIW
ncbi:MAG: hypothetical protein GQ554_02170 [Deltaproteobacteria bacterium]|nr:hypothetical protein [Deltaproteobacteria bacterium]